MSIFLAAFVTLAWDYPPSELPRVTFNLYSTTNLSDWTLKTNVAQQSVQVATSKNAEFFFVTATNIACACESEKPFP
jgi:hypothetical protein